MNRRQFLPAPAVLAGVVLAGREALTQTHRCPNPPCLNPPPRAWKTDTAITHYHDLILPALTKVKEAKKLTALSPAEWTTLTGYHTNLGNAHSGIGNLHVTDLWAQAHQTMLMNKFGAKPTDRILTLGTHALWTQDASIFTAIGRAQTGNSSDIRIWSEEQCQTLSMYAVDLAFLAFFAAVLGLEEWALFFGIFDVILAVTDYTYCG